MKPTRELASLTVLTLLSISSGTGVRTSSHQTSPCCSLTGAACVENIDYRAIED